MTSGPRTLGSGIPCGSRLFAAVSVQIAVAFLRALARERKKRDLGSGPPFELLARADGRLTLVDPSTGARIDLESFGPANAGVFARLMTLNNENRGDTP